MARPPEMMPEGTDAIIPGASADDNDTPFRSDFGSQNQGAAPTPAGAKEAATDIKDEAVKAIGDKTAGIRDQAFDRARSFATQGKDKANDALDNVVRLVDDAAATVDEKVGEQYGDYVRRAGDTLADVAAQFRAKDVDELFVEAREAVRRSPAIAIGAAAAVGFLVARVLKAGTAVVTNADEDSKTPVA